MCRDVCLDGLAASGFGFVFCAFKGCCFSSGLLLLVVGVGCTYVFLVYMLMACV